MCLHLIYYTTYLDMINALNEHLLTNPYEMKLLEDKFKLTLLHFCVTL